MGIQIKAFKFKRGPSAVSTTAQGVTAIPIQPGDLFEVMDPATGKPPADLIVGRVGNNLALSSASARLKVELLDFFNAPPEEPASLRLGSGELEGVSTIQSTGTPLSTLGAGQMGSLALEQTLPLTSVIPAANVGLDSINDTWSHWVSSLSPDLVSAGPAVGVTTMGAAATLSGGGSVAEATSAVHAVSGVVVAGAFVSQVQITLYDKNGTLLTSGTSDGQGHFNLSVGDYVGTVLAVVTDINGDAADYLDEASGQAVDLKVDLRAAGVVLSSGQLSLNITPLTELAVRKLSTTDLVNSDKVISVNKAIAKTFLGLDNHDISTLSPKATNASDGGFNADDGLDTAEKYGAALAALSGMDGQGSDGMTASLEKLSNELTLSDGVATLSSTGWTALRAGVNLAAPKVGGNLTNALASLSPEVAQGLAEAAVVDTAQVAHDLAVGGVAVVASNEAHVVAGTVFIGPVADQVQVQTVNDTTTAADAVSTADATHEAEALNVDIDGGVVSNQVNSVESANVLIDPERITTNGEVDWNSVKSGNSGLIDLHHKNITTNWIVVENWIVEDGIASAILRDLGRQATFSSLNDPHQFFLNADDVARFEHSNSRLFVVGSPSAINSLGLTDAGPLNLTLAHAAIQGVGLINMDNGKANTLTLSANDVLSFQVDDVFNRLMVTGDSHDQVVLDTSAGGTWSKTGTETLSNISYDVYVHSADMINKLLVQQTVQVA